MTRVFKWSQLPLLFAFALATGACGSTGSPAGPSSIGSTARGATISGHVTSSTASVAVRSSDISTLAATSLTVTVVGTNISTAVDGSGQFMLTGVPPGDVTLKFAGNGADATITLSGISATDHITINVTLNGKSARVDNERRDEGEDRNRGDNNNQGDNNQGGGSGDRNGGGNQFDIDGVVSTLSGACPTLTFTIGTMTIKTSSATKYDHGSCAGVANGKRVEVKGTRPSDRLLLATGVTFDN